MTTDKTCESCKHARYYTGEPNAYCESPMSNYYLALIERTEAGDCGPEGAFWEAKQP